MLAHFGWRAVLAIIVSTLGVLRGVPRRAAPAGARRASPPDVDVRTSSTPPVSACCRCLRGSPRSTSRSWRGRCSTPHYPALFVGGFLFFLGFAKATAAYQSHVDLQAPLLVGFFLGGLVIHGGLQGWWIAPMLAQPVGRRRCSSARRCSPPFNDNALITYLATLVPNLDQRLKVAVVEGAVTGGGLTVIANAPNPAGQAILGRFFGGSIMPFKLLMGSLIPTLIAALVFRFF